MAMSRARTERTSIAVFARAPVAGVAKTRLIPLLGAEGAAALHAALARKALMSAVEAKTGEVALWCAPDVSHPFFESCRAEFRIDLKAQPPGDIGQRMLAAFEASRGPLLLIGSDCPMLTPDLLRLCAAELRTGLDAVFLPAEDGGYALIGLRRPMAGIFAGVEWSTERVMDETRARLRAAALTWSEPAIVWDIDRPEDVARLAASGLLARWQPPKRIGL
jgi:rSAM/selenodomain-associated transferase 1